MERPRRGFTTGTAAQVASKAAASMLIRGEILNRVDVVLPCGIALNIGIIDQHIGNGFAVCGVVKDAGDEVDVTHGAKIYAKVEHSKNSGITIEGGDGVGVVTKRGLAVKVGEHAINPVPRKMISKEVSKFLPKKGGLKVTISVAEGENLAKHTFNPRLGIIGGISILGTTGIVEPNSVDAYKVSLAIQLDIAKAYNIKRVALVHGYLGERFCKEKMKFLDEGIVKMGDKVGFMLGECVKRGIGEVVLVGHIGKLSKVAAGIFDTHSSFGDARLEVISAYAGLCGAKRGVIKQLLNLPSAEEAVEILREHNLLRVFDEIAKRVVERSENFVKHQLRIKCIVLSLKGEVLGSFPR
jgi:cobalt-precorrin-5B (C1)-methyltransferase